MKLNICWVFLCFLLFIPYEVHGQRGRGDLCFVWYNVENLFHPSNDSLPGDDEFTPEGLRHWTTYRYQLKLTALAKVIVASGKWEAPEIVGLCEVEEATVLEDLVRHPILVPYNYAMLHCNSPDHRGMDVACIYRPERIGILGWSAIPSRAILDGTRDMLHACLTIGKRDTLDLFLVHLVSKYRGSGATAAYRRIQAEQLLHCMDSVHALRPGSLLMAAGDFNDDPHSYSLEPLYSVRIGEDSLRWLTPEMPLSLAGTYKYQGSWSHLDQVHYCGGAGRFAVSASVLDLPPLMRSDEEYGGVIPFRTYHGYRYKGGLSDHLPLVVLLRRRFPQFPVER